MADFQYIGFEELEKQGFIDEYVEIDHSTKPPIIKPTETVDSLLSKGFKPKGTKLRFLNANGYDAERERAAQVFNQQKEYTVKICRVGRSSSSYEFEEVGGSWNTVMFGVGWTIVQALEWLIETRTKARLYEAAEHYRNELAEYEDVTDFQLTQHIGDLVSDAALCDQYVCSCGWKSPAYYDGAEYASRDWHKHVHKMLLTKPEWPIEKGEK